MRVKVRGFTSGGKDKDGLKGTVREMLPSGSVVVVLDKEAGNLAFKPSQCVILKKKIYRTYWLGTVVHSSKGDYGHHWAPVVAHEQKPQDPLDANGLQWVFVREEKARS